MASSPLNSIHATIMEETIAFVKRAMATGRESSIILARKHLAQEWAAVKEDKTLLEQEGKQFPAEHDHYIVTLKRFIGVMVEFELAT